MRIISYLADGTPSLGVLVTDSRFVAVHEFDPTLPRTLDALLRVPGALARLASESTGTAGTHPLADVTYAPLLEQPHAFWALALNFKTHIWRRG